MNPYRYLSLTAVFAAVLTLGVPRQERARHQCHQSAGAANPANQQPPANAQNVPGAPATGVPAGAATQAAPPPPPAAITLPAGTEVRVRLDEDLSSKDSQPGQTFKATVADDVVVHGETVIPKEAAPRAPWWMPRRWDASKVERFLQWSWTRWMPLGKLSRRNRVDFQGGTGQRQAHCRFHRRRRGLGALIGGLAGGGKGAAVGALAAAEPGQPERRLRQQADRAACESLTFKLERPVRIIERGRDSSTDPALQTR